MSHEENPVPADLLLRLALRPVSVTSEEGVVFGISMIDAMQPKLAIVTNDTTTLGAFDGETSGVEKHKLLLGPLNAKNAAVLRGYLSWLRPQVLGERTSVGLGDRLGLATPGHLRALRGVGGNIAPILAQQSIREMGRTDRTPQQVMDDAMWGAFGEGWRSGFGADADHLKTTDDIDRCVAAGYTFYTFDPSTYVDNTVDDASGDDLQARFNALPWEKLADTSKDVSQRYLASAIDCDGHLISFDEITLRRAAVKYGRAIAHVFSLYQHLAQVNSSHIWEVEVSVDETETPTTPAEHVYWARELARLGVHWVSLAPRFVGRFEKGVDYIGDLDAFAADIAVHAAIARTLGPYKISLHSGSDKFSIYAIAAEATRGTVHLKTAGTSYLEALRTVGQIDPDTLRAIYAFAYPRFETDRASYHVSAQLDRAPRPNTVSNTDALALLDQFDAREILHVTFGSVLTEQTPDGNKPLAAAIMRVLSASPEAYASNLETHFVRHLQPFVAESHA